MQHTLYMPSLVHCFLFFCSITTTVNPDGPFVNENGELDLRNAPPDEGSMYTCTAVDVTGDRLTQQFVVEVVEEGENCTCTMYDRLLTKMASWA